MAEKAISTPEAIGPGSRIGIAAPAGPYSHKKFENGIRVLEELGFEPVIPSCLAARNRYLAGSDAHRARIFMQFITDPSIDAVWCARGGYGSMRLLPLLDYALIRDNPKIVIGFSDITALLVTLYARCAFVTYHGPVITSLGEGSLATKSSITQVVTRGETVTLFSNTGQIISPGEGIGPVIGGNLTILSHLMGTPFMPSLDGHILFVEDCDEKPYRIDRMITQMRLSGCLDHISGLMLGCFSDCGSSLEISAIFEDCFKGWNIPVLGGFDIGHKRTNLTIPIGVRAHLSTNDGRLAFQQPAIYKKSSC